MPLFSFYFRADLEPDQDYETTHIMIGALLSDTRSSAELDALEVALRELPVERGYVNHSVNLMEIPMDMLYRAVIEARAKDEEPKDRK